MKTRFRSVVGLFAFNIALVSFPAAQGQEADRIYLKGDIGGTLMRDTELKEFFGPVIPNSKVRFDPGVRVGFRFGYTVTDWFAVEAETGVMANDIRSITGATEADGQLSNVPFLANARFQLPELDFVTPYFGGGIGPSAVVLDADDIIIGGTLMHGSEGDVVFAYQAFAGLRFRLNENMGLSLEYHYFGTTEPEWEADVTLGTLTDRVRFGRIETHAFTVAFDFSF